MSVLQSGGPRRNPAPPIRRGLLVAAVFLIAAAPPMAPAQNFTLSSATVAITSTASANNTSLIANNSYHATCNASGCNSPAITGGYSGSNDCTQSYYDTSGDVMAQADCTVTNSNTCSPGPGGGTSVSVTIDSSVTSSATAQPWYWAQAPAVKPTVTQYQNGTTMSYTYLVGSNPATLTGSNLLASAYADTTFGGNASASASWSIIVKDASGTVVYNFNQSASSGGTPGNPANFTAQLYPGSTVTITWNTAAGAQANSWTQVQLPTAGAAVSGSVTIQ